MTEQLTTEQLIDRTTNIFLAGVEAKNSHICIRYTLQVHIQDARNLEQDARTTVSFA